MITTYIFVINVFFTTKVKYYRIRPPDFCLQIFGSSLLSHYPLSSNILKLLILILPHSRAPRYYSEEHDQWDDPDDYPG